MIALQSRKYGNKQTTSHFILCDGDELLFQCKILEPKWDDNKQNVSCIPEDTYLVKKHYSNTYGWCFIILDVPNRTDVLFHWGNFYFDTKACMITGEYFEYINNDEQKDVANSRDTFDKLMSIAPDEFKLTIKSDEV